MQKYVIRYFYKRVERCVDLVRRQSMPSKRIAHCAALIDTLPEVASGQMK
jgi:hypothetical protein